MTEKRYSRMMNHYGTSRTYCTGIYDNQNNRELENSSQVIYELNALHEENEQLKKEIAKFKEWEKYIGDVKREDLDRVFRMSIYEIAEAFEYYQKRIKELEDD